MEQAKAFIADRCRLDVEASVGCGQLYDAWVTWCEARGEPHRGNYGHFAQKLHAVLPGIQRRVPVGQTKGWYVGIGLASSVEFADPRHTRWPV